MYSYDVERGEHYDLEDLTEESEGEHKDVEFTTPKANGHAAKGHR